MTLLCFQCNRNRSMLLNVASFNIIQIAQANGSHWCVTTRLFQLLLLLRVRSIDPIPE